MNVIEVYAILKKMIVSSAGGITNITLGADGTSIDITYGAGGTSNVSFPNQLTQAQRDLVAKFSVDANGDLLFDGKEITPDFLDTTGAGDKFLTDDGTYKTISTAAYNDTEVKKLINDNKIDIATNKTDISTNKADIATNKTDITTLTTKIGSTTMGTTATDITGAIKEVNGNLLDNVSFSADYKNIVLNRKNGTNPYTIPIAAIINHAKLIELADIDTADIGNGKTLVYDSATQKHKYADITGTDELVKMDKTAAAHYLADLIDKQTVVNDNGTLKVKKLDGQNVTIAEINYLKGLTMNVMDLVNAFANGGVKVHNTPVATYADLATLDRSKFIDGISYIVYVLADESHAGAKTTYLCTKTSSTYFGNADSQRNFITDPIDLASEVTGKLGTSNIDVDSLWTLLTVDDTYKTLTATDNVFGTHGAKKLYDELTTAIGVKANATDLTTHTDDTDIHITTTERTKWNEVVNKANKTEVLSQDDVLTTTGTETHDNVYSAQLVKTELDKKANDSEVVKKTDIATSISSTSTNDKVAGAKAVFDSLANKLDKTVILTTADEVNSFDREYQSFIIEPSVAEAVGLPKAPDSTWFCINLSHVKDFKYPSQIAFEYAGIERIMYRTAHNGVWHDWRKLCTTSVADVPTVIKEISNDEVSSGTIKYTIINGICHLCLLNFVFTNAGIVYKMLPDNTVPKCAIDECWHPITIVNGGAANALINVSMEGALGHYHLADTSAPYSGYISYPVAE